MKKDEDRLSNKEFIIFAASVLLIPLIVFGLIYWSLWSDCHDKEYEKIMRNLVPGWTCPL